MRLEVRQDECHVRSKRPLLSYEWVTRRAPSITAVYLLLMPLCEPSLAPINADQSIIYEDMYTSYTHV